MIVDTYALVWLVEGEARLGRLARESIEEALRGTGLVISAITVWDIALLAQRGRMALNQEVGGWIQSVLKLPGLRLAPMSLPSRSTPSVSRVRSTPTRRIDSSWPRPGSLGQPLPSADRAILDYGRAGSIEVLDASR